MQKPVHTPITETPIAPNLIIQGTVFGLIAAVGYTAANVCLRYSVGVDPYWVSWVKAIPTVIIFGPLLLVRAVKSQALFPPGKAFAWLVAAAILGQVGGNVVFQWALGVIGLALTVPICLGAMIITGAVTGWLLLSELLTWRTILSICLLITAVTILSLGAPTAQASLAKAASHNVQQVALGVVAAFVSGVSYALLGVAIRNAAQQGCPAVTNVVTVGLAGVIFLFPLCLISSPMSELLATDRQNVLWMIGAGLANAAAFIALTRSLQIIGVIYVNALNATQAAMAAVAGIVLFREPPSGALFFGVFLTALGLILMRRTSSKDKSARVELNDPSPSPKNSERATSE